MPGLLPRLFAGALAILFGGLVGLLVGHERGALFGALLGGLLGFLGILLFDALRGWRLLRWLRQGSFGTTAPRDSGFWGELAAELYWFDPPKTIRQWDPPKARWFEGGTTDSSDVRSLSSLCRKTSPMTSGISRAA